MKKTILLTLLFICSLSYSQKKEKVKGSKIVTSEIKKIEDFNSLEVLDNVEVFLIKGSDCGIEIEADDNLHDVINIVLNGSTLQLSTLKEAFGYKKLSIRVTYKEDFSLVIARDEASITALSDVDLSSITFKTFNYSKLFVNSKSTNLTLLMDDKSTAELNSKSEKTNITLSKNTKLNALITSKDLSVDMYQKSVSEIQGDVENFKLRLDSNSHFNGIKLTTKKAEALTESYSKASLLVIENLILDASGKSEIEVYGDQKIDLKRFIDNAVLIKKPTK